MAKKQQSSPRGSSSTGQRSGSRPASRSGSRPSKGEAAPTGIAGRDSGFVGVVLVVVGVLLILALWFDLAGLVGRGTDTLLSWILGGARHLLPLALIGGGVALIREGGTSSPSRVALGWTLISAAALGGLHVVDPPTELGDTDALAASAGVLGALVGEPLVRLLSPVGAAVLLLAALVSGAALITRTSLRTMALGTGHGIGAVLKPLVSWLRRSIADLSTLQSERAERRRNEAVDDESDPAGDQPGRESAPIDPLSRPPRLYDGADDVVDEAATAQPAPAKKLWPRLRSAPTLRPDHWALPPAT